QRTSNRIFWQQSRQCILEWSRYLLGVFDQELEEEILKSRREDQQIIFWDVDAPATLDRMIYDPTDYFIPLIPQFDQILTYGGGGPVEAAYKNLGAKDCTSIYNAFDP